MRSTPVPPQVMSWGAAPADLDRRLHRGLLLEIALCAFPAMLAVKIGAPQLGARWLFLSLVALMGLNLLISSPVANLALITGLVPAIILLRNLFLYNSPIILLVLALGAVAFRSRRDIQKLRLAGFGWLLFPATLFWIASYALTGDYSSNLRILELVLGAAAVVVLAGYREFLATALFGTIISLIAIGVGFFGYGNRLGYGIVDGVLLGNPISFGEPLALLLLLINADGGKWMLLQRNATVRLALSVLIGLLLLLSTSRGSWLVAGAGLGLIFLMNRRSRKGAVVAVCALVIAGAAASQTSRGADLTMWITRTFSDKRSLSKRTSGRTDQWLLLPTVLAAEPPWGFGPGSGPRIYAHYSALDPRVHLDPGHGMAWHSLYLQLAVETGAGGLVLLSLLIFAVARSGIRYWRNTGEVMPLVGLLGFLLIALTVSGMDVPSGMYLGFGLLSGWGSGSHESLATNAGAPLLAARGEP